jgi:TonB family protein
MNVKWVGLSLAILITVSFSARAKQEVTLNSQFKTAYFSYQGAVKNNDADSQFKYATEAYQLGSKFYGTANINTANLALILARLHLDKNQKEQATSLLLNTLNAFKVEYGDSAIDLAEIYILLGLSLNYDQRKKSINYHLKALSIAEEHAAEHPFFNAQIQLEAGIALLRLGSSKSNAILTAQEFFKDKLSSNDKRVIESNFYAGKYYLTRRKYSKSVDYFESNLPVFKALEGATHPLELNTHAFLVNALEKSGKSDEATNHCIAIGLMTPWDDSQEPIPLFRVEPKYPVDYARRGKSGYVIIGFTISDFGTVLDTKVLESIGGKQFERTALAALNNWRYAPKFEDGKPVEKYATVQLDFKMRK